MKESWKPGTLIYPLPAVLVSCGATPEEYNLLTVAWTGTVCTNPPMCYISVRPERHSYEIIRRTGEFVINLTTRDLARAADWCGVRSGRPSVRTICFWPRWSPCRSMPPISTLLRGVSASNAPARSFTPTANISPWARPSATSAGRCAGSRAGRRAPPPQSPHLLRGISRLRKFPKHPGQTPGTGSPPQNVSLRENP